MLNPGEYKDETSIALVLGECSSQEEKSDGPATTVTVLLIDATYNKGKKRVPWENNWS